LRMSQSKLAELCGINRNTISKIEKGDYESVRLSTLSDIALALGMVWQMRMLPVEDLEKQKDVVP